MSEFGVHHNVSLLLQLLGRHGDAPETYVDLVLRHTHPYGSAPVSATAAKGTIARHATHPEAFLQLCEQVKTTQARELEPLLYVLSKIVESPDVRRMLEQAPGVTPATAASVAAGTPAPGGARRRVMHDAPPPDRVANQQPRAAAAAATSGASQQPVDIQALRHQLVTATASSVARQPQREPQDKEAQLAEQRRRAKLGTLPKLPLWTLERPYLSRDFFRSRRPASTPALPIGSLPREVQELAIVDDLLFLMMGIEGKYISVAETVMPGATQATRNFEPDESLDPSLREMVDRVLPLCWHYSKVVRFVEAAADYRNGCVNQALAAAMRGLIKEYLILVAQLEHQFTLGALTLQKLWFYVQPCFGTMEVLASIATSIAKGRCSGGAVLTLLHDRTMAAIGDAKLQDLCLYLTQAASAPYLELVENWIYNGSLADPYSEFMVEGGTDGSRYNSADWDRMHVICPDRVPTFLAKTAEMVLSSGKYLNVIRQCGRNVHCPFAQELVYTLHDREYTDNIERAFEYANGQLLELMWDEMRLMERLRSIKRYFLMEQGDFFVHFMDVAEGELQKPLHDIVPTRLEALLELSLRTSNANKDPFKDDLGCRFMPFNVITELYRIMNVSHDYKGNVRGDVDFVTPASMSLDGEDAPAPQLEQAIISGLEAFTFDYNVPWPLSLVLHHKALKRYQLLFRHTFYCMHIGRKLRTSWMQHAKHLTAEENSRYTPALALRQRMLQFVEQYLYYVTTEVIESNWHTLETKLQQATTVEELLKTHGDFLDTCLKESMLTSPSLLKTVSKLLAVCLKFSDFLTSALRQVSLRREGIGAARSFDTASAARLQSAVQQFDATFTKEIHTLFAALEQFSSNQSEHQMANVVTRLDFNDFFRNHRVS